MLPCLFQAGGNTSEYSLARIVEHTVRGLLHIDSVPTTTLWTTAQPQIHQPYFATLSSPVILGRMSTPSSPLDPDTYDGMLRTLQHRTQDIAEKAGQSHVQRPQDFAADPFHGYPPPFPDAKDDPERVYFTMIDNPHPPCTASIGELEPITLSELVMDSHHRGKFLLVRFERDTGCKRLSASACVRDSQSDVECLSISFVCMNSDVGHRCPPQGHWFAIKEPHLTIPEMSRDPYIRIDHPSDLVEAACLPQAQLTRAVFSEIRAVLHEESPLQYKEAGKTQHSRMETPKALWISSQKACSVSWISRIPNLPISKGICSETDRSYSSSLASSREQ